MSNTNMLDIFNRVTHKIISDLEQGVRPWEKPWRHAVSGSPTPLPQRHNGIPYNGVNILLLWDAASEHGYQNSTWMTLKQAQDYGACIRKGEKASWIIYANQVTKTEVNEETGKESERQIPFLRGYNVFNAEQIDGLPEKFFLKPAPLGIGCLDHVDQFIKNTGATIRHGGDRAYYSEINDYIQIPFRDQFKDDMGYYATLAHEATHWTKHENRLNRDFGRIFWGDEGYAKEELVAEIGAAFLCADLGISPEPREDHAAYIEAWLKAFQGDKKLIFAAASHATRAVNYLKSRQLTIKPDIRPDEEIVSRYQTLYVSKPFEIGKYHWRLRLERAEHTIKTQVEFQDKRNPCWHSSHDWPSYNTNDTHPILPSDLSKLLEREQSTLIKYGLGLFHPMNKQLKLSL